MLGARVLGEFREPPRRLLRLAGMPCQNRFENVGTVSGSDLEILDLSIATWAQLTARALGPGRTH